MEQKERNFHTAKIQVEKLEGGYISDALGKRKIYKQSAEIEYDLNIPTLLDNIEDGEYILAIDLVPRQDFVNAALNEEHAQIYHKLQPGDIIAKAKELNEPGWQKAVENGIIQKADEFDPIIHKDHSGPISVGLANCYTIDELLKFDWKDADAKIPLTNSEKAQITGLKDVYIHKLWPKILSNTFQWTVLDTRIKMTILAKFYQQKLDKKAKIETLPPRNDKRIMEVVTEMELLAVGGLVKSNVLRKKLEALKKLLIQD